MGRFNENVIAKIEQELQAKLPDTYKRVLLKYPFPPDSDAAYYDLYGDPEVILEDNKYYINNGINGLSWPNHHFIIGNDGAGDIFFIDLNSPNSPIFKTPQNSNNEKSLTSQEVAKDILEFIEQIRERDLAFEEEEPSELEENKKMKKRSNSWE